MKNSIDHKELWNLKELVDEYNNYQPRLTTAEHFLIKKAKKIVPANADFILCVGCGAGREVLPLHKHFSTAKIYANDIAEKMLENAKANFINWHIENAVTMLPGSIEEVQPGDDKFNIITCFNNVLNFITERDKRTQVLKKLYEINAHGSVLIGVVHNVFGTPQKTLYFILRKLFAFYFKEKWNNRLAGRKAQKYVAHYFTKNELNNLLSNAGYKKVEIISLAQLHAINNKRYNRLKGSNNLMFFAVKE